MKKLAIVSLLLVIALVSLSAYLRLQNSGIGCPDWPTCYGNIGAPEQPAASVGDAYERLVDDATRPMSWATPAHRLVASVLGLLIVAMTLVSIRRRRDRFLSVTLLALTVFLAWLGIYSGGLHSPAVVMGNLLGGFLMLGLLGWMVFRHDRPRAYTRRGVRPWVIAALLILGVQIALGGLTSANFAASACQTVPDCHGSWWPGSDLATALDLSRAHEVGPEGFVLGGAERADIHKLHRLVAVVTLLVVLGAGVLALRARMGLTAALVIVVVAAEFAVGVAAILTGLPIGIAVAHNWLAGLLLLSLLRLLALCNNREALR